MEITRLFDLIPYFKQTYPQRSEVFSGKASGKWYSLNIDEYAELSDIVSYGLLKFGIKKGYTIATVSNNRPEWNYLDMGIMQIGAIHVPIYPTISDADYSYILNHAEVKLVFTSSEELYRRLEILADNSCCIQNVYAMNEIEGAKKLSDFLKMGRENPQAEELSRIKSGIDQDDLATLIYTSGTTGKPKGVMLTHKNIVSNIVATVTILPPMGPESKALSYLPLSHIYERMINYAYQYKGFSVYYVESLATIIENIREVHPDIMTTVPRLLEKVYGKIESTGRKLKGFRKQIYFWAFKLANRYELHNANGFIYWIQWKLADLLVYKKWRQAMGGRLSLISCGGAALSPRVSRLFWAAKMMVFLGYGLTETSPIVAVPTFKPFRVRIGTVGPALTGVSLKIAVDGEVLCKGPNVMKGYYKDPDLTSQVIDEEGWFHTGDLGVMEDGFLRLVGRKKEIFKTSLGKYVSPQTVENTMMESPFIDNIMVVGENQKFAAALIIPDFEHLRSWCKIKSIPYFTDDEIIRDPLIKKRIKREIDKLNLSLGSTEQLKNFTLLHEDWSIASGELTPSLKLRRAIIAEKHKDIINAMFE